MLFNRNLPIRCHKTSLRAFISWIAGMEITENFCLSCRKVSNLPVHHYFCQSTTVPDITTSENKQNVSLCFGKVSKIFTSPPLLLAVPNRWTVSNFHPWDAGMALSIRWISATDLTKSCWDWTLCILVWSIQCVRGLRYWSRKCGQISRKKNYRSLVQLKKKCYTALKMLKLVIWLGANGLLTVICAKRGYFQKDYDCHDKY